jgi:hypothetical protein
VTRSASDRRGLDDLFDVPRAHAAAEEVHGNGGEKAAHLLTAAAMVSNDDADRVVAWAGETQAFGNEAHLSPRFRHRLRWIVQGSRGLDESQIDTWRSRNHRIKSSELTHRLRPKSEANV